MDEHNAPHGKILVHCEGLGAPFAEMVRQRARELARIDGRTEPTDQDWRNARKELSGGHPMEAPEEVEAFTSDGVAPNLGRRAPRIGGENDESLGEELVAEGMDEALHEQMLEASRELGFDEEEPRADRDG